MAISSQSWNLSVATRGRDSIASPQLRLDPATFDQKGGSRWRT